MVFPFGTGSAGMPSASFAGQISPSAVFLGVLVGLGFGAKVVLLEKSTFS